MPDPDPLQIPTEIPWQLASTTQHLGPNTLGPETTCISMFTYSPQLASLDKDYPDDHLVYLKFTVSVAPIDVLDSPSPPPNDPLNLFGTDVLPIWRVLFDVRISPRPFAPGGIRPYFLAAAPVRRAMIETGIVGQQVTEGDSKSLAIGKSGAQMHESFSSTVDTDTSSGNFPLPVGGFGSSDSSTTASGSRDVTQHIDTTQRDASTERQQLVSHMTNVSNVLSLLSLYGVGSPYLRFSLWARPLRPLTIDPSDPNLWYAELLQRRSSGMEGIQEFYAIAAVPRSATGFCIKAQLRRFSVLPEPLPDPSQFEIPPGSFLNPNTKAILEDYLHRLYPSGTPIDQLDVDPVAYWPTKNPKTNRPVVNHWWIGSGSDAHLLPDLVSVGTTDFDPDQPKLETGSLCIYKNLDEAWLDMKKDEFQVALAKSPLADGIPIFKDLTLNACFGVEIKALKLSDELISAGPMTWFNAKIATPVTKPISPGPRPPDPYRQAVFAWNAAERQFGNLVSHGKPLPIADLHFNHPKLVDFALRQLAAPESDDLSNVALDAAAPWFGLQSDRVATLKAAGIVDVQGLAEAILHASTVARVNKRRSVKSGDGIVVAPGRIEPPALIPVIIPPEEAIQLRAAFGATLEASRTRLRAQQTP